MALIECKNCGHKISDKASVCPKCGTPTKEEPKENCVQKQESKSNEEIMYLSAVSCLEEIGILTTLGQWLNNASNGNHYLVTGAIGILSSIVDNVPLVAGCMGMYPLAPTGDMAVDGIFWQLLAYCAGVGGSLLIIGSAAGVVVMGLEKITFGWYMKHITPVAFIGYLAGIVCYWLLRTFI